MMRPFPPSPSRPGIFLRNAAAAYGLIWLAALAPFFFSGTLPGGWTDDTNTCFIPYRGYLMRMTGQINFPDLAAGEFFGQPMMTYGQPMLLYPTVLAGLIFPISNHLFFLLDLWIHAVAASLGFACLLRRRGCRVATALALGWVYPNTSAFLFRTFGHWTMVHQAALLPWLLLAWERLDLMRPGRWARPALAFSCVLSLVLINRTPHWPFLLAIALAPLETWRAVRRHRRFPIRLRLGVLAAIAGLALLLAAADVFPPLLALSDSFRAAGKTPDLPLQWPLSFINLLGFISPYAWFGAGPGDFFGNWYSSESLPVVGRGVFLLAGLCLVSAGVRRGTWTVRRALPLALISVGLLFGLSGEIPPIRKTLDLLPLYGSLRAWGRASTLVVIGILLLAADGLDSLARPSPHARRNAMRAVLLAAIFACLLATLRGLLGSVPESVAELLIKAGWHVWRFKGNAEAPSAALLTMHTHLGLDAFWYLLWAGPLAGIGLSRTRLSKRCWMAVAVALLFWEALAFQRFVYQARTAPLTPDTVPALAATLRELRRESHPAPVTVGMEPSEMQNFALLFEGIRSPNGADSNLRAPYALWLNEVQGLPPLTNQLSTTITRFTPDLLDVTGLEAVVERDGESPPRPDPSQRPASPFNYRVLVNDKKRPYAEVKAPPPGDSSPSSDISLPDIFGNRLGGKMQPTVTVLAWREDRVRLRVHASRGATLVVREFPDPNWRVRVNGERVEPQWVDNRLTVHIPEGGGNVTLTYVDLPARVCVALCLLGWLAALGIFVATRRKRPPTQ